MNPSNGSRSNVGLVTCVELPEPDHDEELLLAALARRGLDARLLSWDDESQDPASCELLVLRSAWNYHLAPETFRKWIDLAAARTSLLNPAPVLHWNLHKGYLRQLEAEGIPVVPTAWVERGHSLDLAALGRERGWGEVVLKPAVSAGSFDTRRLQAGAAEASAFLTHLTTRGDAMIQPFLRSVEERGERALVWIDGCFTHAIRKDTRYAGQVEAVSAALPIAADELELGKQALACALGGLESELLYARVDLMLSDSGELLVSELELMEPSLFLLQSPAALERLADAIVVRLHSERSAGVR